MVDQIESIDVPLTVDGLVLRLSKDGYGFHGDIRTGVNAETSMALFFFVSFNVDADDQLWLGRVRISALSRPALGQAIGWIVDRAERTDCMRVTRPTSIGNSND